MKNLGKRLLSLVLAGALLLGYVPAAAFAVWEDGLCAHHTEHTPECGYRAAVEAAPCLHEHGAECYRLDTACVHTDCGEEPCDHVCSEESGCVTRTLSCQHVHGDDCGYREPAAEIPCTYVCPLCSEEEPVEEQPTEEQPTEEEPTEEEPAEEEPAEEEPAEEEPAEEEPAEEEPAEEEPAEEEPAEEEPAEEEPAQEEPTQDESALEQENKPVKSLEPSLAATVVASGTCGANLTWTLTGDGTLTITGSGAMEDYTTISPWYSYRSRIKTVSISQGVTTIGSEAFYDCDSLTSVTISEGVTTIGSEAFYDCDSLTSVTISEGVTTIGSKAFYNCRSLTSITIPEGVTSIGYWAFYYCTSLTSIIIPVSVGSIGTQAFSVCNSLSAVTYTGTMAQWASIGYDFPANCTDGTLLKCGSCGADGSNVNYYLTDKGELNIVGSGAMKEYDASSQFPWDSNRSQIKTVSISQGVTTISSDAFIVCSSLTSVTIPEGVTAIGSYAFFNCSSLTSVVIPEGVTTIESDVFGYCSSMTSVTIPEGVTTIGSSAFFECSSLASVTIPEGVTTIGSYAFYNCDSLTSVVIPEGVTTIESNAFLNCDSLTSITIPVSVSSIGSSAFSSCSSLSVATYAGTMEQWAKIGYDFPANCTDGTLLLLGSCGTNGNDVIYYLTEEGVLFFTGNGAMKDFGYYTAAPWQRVQSQIKMVSICQGVTSIGSYAFNRCRSLTSITIPVSVTSIGSYALSDCSSLSAVTYGGTMEQWRSLGYHFSANCTDGTLWSWGSCGSNVSFAHINDTLAITGSGVMNSYATSSSNVSPWYNRREFIKNVSIEEGITYIGSYAFYDCTSLISITIPASVTSIVYNAFSSCDSLEIVTYGGTVAQWKALGYHIPARCSDGTLWCWKDNYCELVDGTLTITRSGSMNQSDRSTWLPYLEKITALVLPNGLTNIPEGAFQDCVNLTAVVIPKNITTIGASAFAGCTALQQITFDHNYGGSLTIGQNAFRLEGDGLVDTEVSVLTRVRIPAAIWAYDWAGSGRSVRYRSTVPGLFVGTGGPFQDEVGQGETIPMVAEADNQPQNVTWSVENGTGAATIDAQGMLTGVTTGTVTVYAQDELGNEAACTVKVVRYVDSITIFLNGKQSMTRLGVGERVQLSAGLTPEDPTYTAVTWQVINGTGSATYNSNRKELTGTSVGTVTLVATATDQRRVSASVELTITDTIRSYPVTGGNLYYNTETGFITGSDGTVTDVVIPAVIDGVTIVGIAPYAFNNDEWGWANTTLKSVSIPKTVREIGDHAFYNCTALSNLRFAENGSLTTIGAYAFYYCTALTSLTIPDTVTTIGTDAFYLGWDSALKHLTLSGELDPTDWMSCGRLESVTFTGKRIISQPHEVQSGNLTFHRTNTLPGRNAQKVMISDSVEVIEPHALCANDYITEVVIGNHVTTIQDYAFGELHDLTKVTMGSGVISLGAWVFDYCNSLEELTLPEGIKTLGEDAFHYCTSLKRLNLPDSLESVGRSCFNGCKNLQLIDLSGIPDVISDEQFLLNSQGILPPALEHTPDGANRVYWSMQTVEGQPDAWDIARITYVNGEESRLMVIGYGKIKLVATDDYSAAQGSKIVELKEGITIRPADQDYVVSGGKLQLSAWKRPGNVEVEANWAITAGQEYATISSSGLLTAKSVTSTQRVTVKATPKDGTEPASRVLRILPKATAVRVSTEDGQTGTLMVDVGTTSYLNLTARCEPADALNRFTWYTSNAKVASVTQEGKVLLRGTGTAVITAKASDGSGVQGSITIVAEWLDYSPRLLSSTVSLSTYSMSGTTLELRESYGNAIESAALVNPPAGLKLEGLTLYATGMKTGTYKNVRLDVTCANGATYTYKLQVKVGSALPSVTVKQAEKLNLFYLGSRVGMDIQAPGQTIRQVALKGTGDFQLEQEDGRWYLSRTDTVTKKPVTKATLEVSLEGYTVPVKKSVTLLAGTTAPKLVLQPASSTIHLGSGASLSTRAQVFNQTAGEMLDLTDVYVLCSNSFVNVEKDTEHNALVFTLTGTKGGTASITLQKPGWSQAVKLSHKITASTKQPVLKLGTGTLTLQHYFANVAAQTTAALDQRNVALTGVTIVSTSKAALEAQKLELTYDNGTITARIKDSANLPKAGSYTYSCTGLTQSGATKSVTLKVTVSSASPKLTLSAKGKLDTLKPESTMVFTPKLTNCIGTVQSVTLAGGNQTKFTAQLVDGKIVLRLKEGQTYVTNAPYKLWFNLNVSGKTILSPEVKVTVTQSKLKLTAVPASLTLYLSQRSPLRVTLTATPGQIASVAMGAKTAAELKTALDLDGLTYDRETGLVTIPLRNTTGLKAGKSYTLYLEITPRNNAENLAPTQLKLTVKVAK